MTIKYAQLTISIHGLDADDDALEFLQGWLKGATKSGLLGHQKDRFRFRNEFESDIEVEVTETAGETTASEIDRLRAALAYISTSCSGGELFPVGPAQTEYEKDGNTVSRYVPPWHFLHGTGDTFLDAVEDAIDKARVK